MSEETGADRTSEPGREAASTLTAAWGGSREASIMSFADDEEFREIARGIEKKVPEWIVVWGVYTRQFVAFPLWREPRGVVLAALYPDALIDRMRDAERQVGNISAEDQRKE